MLTYSIIIIIIILDFGVLNDVSVYLYKMNYKYSFATLFAKTPLSLYVCF